MHLKWRSDRSPGRRLTQGDWSLAGQNVTVSNFKWAISNVNPFKLPRGDGIYPVPLQTRCGIFTARLAFGCLPQPWRTSSHIYPKTWPDNLMDCRLISLSSFLVKRLVNTVSEGGGSPHRERHQPGTSVESDLHHLTIRTEYTTGKKEIMLAEFLDSEWVFDKTS